jgi:hypothetical protein
MLLLKISYYHLCFSQNDPPTILPKSLSFCRGAIALFYPINQEKFVCKIVHEGFEQAPFYEDVYICLVSKYIFYPYKN